MEDTPITLGMALMDFIPNLGYLVGAYFLVRLILRERGQRCGRMAMLGALLVFLGGTLKATSKLLDALNNRPYTVNVLSEAQFVMLAIGFLGTVTALILLARERRPSTPLSAALLFIAPWKIPFLLVMTLCQFGALGLLTYLSFRRKIILSGALFITSAVLTLLMAGMASGSQVLGMQWIEQSINSLAQISFAIAAFKLDRTSQQQKAIAC
ncbi:MAG: hypothetical protein KA988_04980 [Longilinea sp.]|nr:hypothetical protein [Longilinea sp.]